MGGGGGGGSGGSGGGATDNGGEVLWRKLVERNLMRPEKEKPVYKVLFFHSIQYSVQILFSLQNGYLEFQLGY